MKNTINPDDVLNWLQERDVFPLRDSFFEGVHVKIPFEYMTLLTEEYGTYALSLNVFQK